MHQFIRSTSGGSCEENIYRGEAGLHLDALLSSPSSFLSAGAESAAQHPVNACCMLREVMRGHH